MEDNQAAPGNNDCTGEEDDSRDNEDIGIQNPTTSTENSAVEEDGDPNSEDDTCYGPV